MLYDVLLIGVILLSVITGYKKGAAKTILSALSILLSVLLAVFVSRILADFIYDAFFREALQSKINAALENSVVGTVTDAATSVINAVPAVIVGAMSFFGLSRSGFENYCNDAITRQEAEASVSIADKLSPVVTGLITLVLTIVLFILFSFIFRLLVKPVSKIFKLPLIRTPDSLLGGVLGLVKGIVVVLVIAMLLRLVIPFVPSEWTFLSEESISKSYLFSFVYDGGFLRWISQFIYRIG